MITLINMHKNSTSLSIDNRKIGQCRLLGTGNRFTLMIGTSWTIFYIKTHDHLDTKKLPISNSGQFSNLIICLII